MMKLPAERPKATQDITNRQFSRKVLLLFLFSMLGNQLVVWPGGDDPGRQLGMDRHASRATAKGKGKGLHRFLLFVFCEHSDTITLNQQNQTGHSLQYAQVKSHRLPV